MTADLMNRIAGEKFVSLTTFKRDGTPVAVPMWIARSGDRLVVWTPAESWKVKRVRRDARVELTPCTRMGKVDADGPVLRGTAEVITDPAAVESARGHIKAKYGLAFRVITSVEAVLSGGRKPRVALLISPTG